MSSTAITMPTPPLFDEARLAVAGFLARYSGPTRKSYVSDLRQFFAWCASVDLEVFATKRGHIELWARSMEEKGLARATIGRRLSTVAGFYRICVLSSHIPTGCGPLVVLLGPERANQTRGWGVPSYFANFAASENGMAAFQVVCEVARTLEGLPLSSTIEGICSP